MFNQEELSCSSRGSRDPNLKPSLLGKRNSHLNLLRGENGSDSRGNDCCKMGYNYN